MLEPTPKRPITDGLTAESTHAARSTQRGRALTTATAGEAQIRIKAAPLMVYELISDITRMGDWSPECYRCDWLDAATTVDGARFRGHNRLGKVRWHTDAIVTVADRAGVCVHNPAQGGPRRNSVALRT